MVDQSTLGLWLKLGPTFRQKVRAYNLALLEAVGELEDLAARRGVTFDQVIEDPSAEPMVRVLVSEIPGIVGYILNEVLPVVVNDLRPHLTFDRLPSAYTRCVLQAIISPSLTTSMSQGEILDQVAQFGEQLLLGEQITAASDDAQAPQGEKGECL